MPTIQDSDIILIYRGGTCYRAMARDIGCAGALIETLATPLGTEGPAGATGATGPQGPKGDTGDTGAQGPTGPTGADGAQGIQGVKGDTGAQGIQGVKGDTGDTGAQGAQGPAGADGVRTATSAFGYASGAGGTVTQQTSKSTGVTLNKLCGQITMNGAALAAAAEVAFTLTNNQIAATDVVVANVQSVGTAGSYFVTVGAVAAGSCSITVGNTSAGSLSQALVLNFVVIKGVSA